MMYKRKNRSIQAELGTQGAEEVDGPMEQVFRPLPITLSAGTTLGPLRDHIVPCPQRLYNPIRKAIITNIQ